MDGLLDSEIRYTFLKEEPGSFNAATQRAIALEAISKAESSPLRGRRNGHTRSFNKMLEQQERHTQIMEKILETQARFLSESSQSRFQSTIPGRAEGFRPRTSAMQCYNCREFGHLSNQCPQKGTIQPGISANLDTDRQPIVKSILQRANSEQVSSINKVQAEAVFGPTVYVMYEQRSKLGPFREEALSANNIPFEILGVFTGEITFDTGVKVKADLLVTPNTDVPWILRTQVMEEKKVSIDFHSKQLMMEKESNQNETGNLAQVGTEAGLSVNDANTSHTLPSKLSSSSLRDTPGQRPVGSRKGSANQLRSPAHHLRSPGREGMMPGYPTMPPDFRMARRGRGGAGHMMSPYDPNDPYSMPYMHHHPHHPLGMRPPQHMLPHQYYMEPPGSLNRHFRGHGMIHGSGLRHPPGCYPADNTHQMILHKVELLNRHTRRKFLMPNVPPSQGQMSDEQFGSSNLQEYVSPDNSEHAATLSSESERSHRSHHVDDDLEDGQRRTDRGSFHKQNSSDNYEHEQPNRRSSLQGGTSEDSSTTNTTGANIQPAGSNSSLHTTGLELGAMPRSSGGYSCSVPATPEHRRYLPPGTDWASLSYAGHPGMPAHPAEFAMMRGRSRGVPYGYHPRNPRHPGPPTQGRMPFRHPSQYRSMPAHAAYGYYPRGRPRHMAPMYASSRYSSQEDFRGSSRSIAMYPGEYPPPTMDPNDPRLPVRRRIRGSRESLDGQSRESRGLSKSYPSENRSSSMPPAEDRLGDEDEAVLNRLADPALNSSHNVPSLINSLRDMDFSFQNRTSSYFPFQEQKPDRDCDEWENGSLTGSIIAIIEEEKALDPKLDNKKSDQAVPFACFSTDTGPDALKEVQGASSVKNTSIKSARTILSTVLNDYTDYQDHILSNEASEKISEKTSLKSEQPASCTQKTVKRRAPAVNNPERVGS
ncbi:uncharacterized protein LOC142354850 [Convolutriloba macropyga]|uniref:uncharacterized protein LOC142354850 n=1 Tax=Convolutriloba macropyga TaxID=536237 RepID=UPI003F528214